jgi:hypothetical protein
MPATSSMIDTVLPIFCRMAFNKIPWLFMCFAIIANVCFILICKRKCNCCFHNSFGVNINQDMMKTIILLLITLLSATGFSQPVQDTLKKRIIALTPLSEKVSHVNGLAVGLGQINGGTNKKVINGVNLEVNPLALFLLAAASEEDTVLVIQNGLHISAGGFMGRTVHNGVGVSLYNYTVASRGISITGFTSVSKSFSGLHTAIFFINGHKASGVTAAFIINNAETFKGLQICGYNKAKELNGLQIGVFNRTQKLKGVQIGLWNINEKRALPLINWNFKK